MALSCRPQRRRAQIAKSQPKPVDGDTNGHGDAFIRDLRTGQTVRISMNGTKQANGPSGPDYAPQVTLADDGRHAAFVSEATNLTASADTNDAPNVFRGTPPRPASEQRSDDRGRSDEQTLVHC